VIFRQTLLLHRHGHGRGAAVMRGEDDVQVGGVVVMLEAIKAGDGTGTMKQDNVRMGTEIVDDAINLVNGQSINPKILIPGIMIDKDNIDQYLPKS
jgi:ABC-type sugar transport system substrate-binding protein